MGYFWSLSLQLRICYVCLIKFAQLPSQWPRLTGKCQNSFSAVQSEKNEIILKKNGRKSSFTFLLLICLFYHMLSVVLVKFSLCQNENARKRHAHLRLQRRKKGENLVEPTGSARNKIFGSEQPWVAL